MKARTLTFQLILLLVFAFAAADNFAANLTITKIEDTSDGVCDADCSLREAVAAAASEDTIVFSSLFDVPQTITLVNGQISIDKGLTITGPGSHIVTIDGNMASRIFFISGTDPVRLSGMRLTNGWADTKESHEGGAIRVDGNTLRLVGLRIDHNRARYTSTSGPFFDAGFGGGIFLQTGELIIQNSTVDSNASLRGGGIFIYGGSFTAENCDLISNSGNGIEYLGAESIFVSGSTINGNSQEGIRGPGGSTFIINSTISNNRRGGVGNSSGTAILTIVGSTITGNRLELVFDTQRGAGIRNVGTATIQDCVISDNTVFGNGGGIHNGNRAMHIIDSTIVNNVATGVGGGINNLDGDLYVTNTTVSGNNAGTVANTRGGGIYTGTDRLVLTNATIAENRSTGPGGGVYNSGGMIPVSNTIIANNFGAASAPDVFGTFASRGHNLIENTTGSKGWLQTDLTGADPLLGPLTDNGGDALTHPLLPGSPAIDAGDDLLSLNPKDNMPLVTDQRGMLRIISSDDNPAVDIGAFEALYSAGQANVSGRLLGRGGRYLSGALLTLTAQNGGDVLAEAITNPFGYYRFNGLGPSLGYSLSPIHKSFVFAPNYSFTIVKSQHR